MNPAVPNTQDGDTSDPNDLIGWNFVNNSNNPADDEGHGTFTAGEIGEVTNNTIGGAGLVWNAQIMPVVFLNSSGSGTDTAAAEAIEYAVNHGAKVINASWGGTGTDSTIETAIQYANANGVIIVAAAGNNGADDDTTFFSPASYSAQYPNLISVAAIGSNGALASFSDYGVGTVQLAAPGVNVYSTLSNGTYGTMSGTSMAAPMVTGAIALVEAAHPSWTMSQVIDAVLDHVTPDASLAGKVTTGGVLNVGAAVANTDGPYVVSGTPDGSINSSGGLSTVQLTFNEEINPATFTSADVTLTGPGGVIPAGEVSVTAADGSNDHSFQLSFPAQTAAGTYTLTVGPGVQDWYGNDMNQNRNATNGEAVGRIHRDHPSDGSRFDRSPLDHRHPHGDPRRYLGDLHRHRARPERRHRYRLRRHRSFHQHGFPGGAAGKLSLHRGERRHPHVHRRLQDRGHQAITATDTVNQAIAGTEENFAVSPGAAKSLKVTGFPTTDTAGTSRRSQSPPTILTGM